MNDDIILSYITAIQRMMYLQELIKAYGKDITLNDALVDVVGKLKSSRRKIQNEYDQSEVTTED